MRGHQAGWLALHGDRRAAAAVLLVACPKNAEERRRAASRGGRSRPSREVRLIKDEIKDTIAGVKDGSLDRNIARAMFSGYSVLLDYIKLERGVFLEEELAARLEALKGEHPNAS
jgi:hypothetical protein